MTASPPTRRTTANVPVTPDGFSEEMTRLVRMGRAEAAAAFFDRHAPAVLDHLSDHQRTLLDALMEYADTVVELEAAGQAEPEGRPEQPTEAPLPGGTSSGHPLPPPTNL